MMQSKKIRAEFLSSALIAIEEVKGFKEPTAEMLRTLRLRGDLPHLRNGMIAAYDATVEGADCGLAPVMVGFFGLQSKRLSGGCPGMHFNTLLTRPQV